MSRIESRLPASGETYERNMAAYQQLRGQITSACAHTDTWHCRGFAV